MSWANIKELIFQERKMLAPASVAEFPQDSAFESQHSALLGCYLKTKSQVDGAVAYFAQTLEWPELSPLDKFFVVARLDFAWEIVSVLNTLHEGENLIGYPSPEKCKTSDLLEWLLIDVWPYGCGRFLQTQRWMAEQSAMPQKQSPRLLAAEAAKAKCVA